MSSESESKMMKDFKSAFMSEFTVGFDFDKNPSEIEWYSTGSRALDMQLNGGRLDRGGIPSGKLTIFSGYKSCGKTYFAMMAAIDFVTRNSNGYVFFFDSEYNVTIDTFINAGLNRDMVNRVVIVKVATMEEFRTKLVRAFKLITDSIGSKEKQPIRGFIILDSIGGLIPQKAYDEANAEPNKETGIAEVKSSMGRPQQVIKEFTKIGIHEAAKLNVPMIFISHVYRDTSAANPMYAKNIMSGGEGLYYFNSNLAEFSRSLSKDDKVENKTQHEVNGILVKCKLVKSRFAREETRTQSLIHFNLGVLKNYGFISIMEQAGIVVKKGYRFYCEKYWNDKGYTLREINSDQNLIEPLMLDLEKWTVAQFGLGKMSLSVGDSIIESVNSSGTIDFENILAEEDPDFIEGENSEV